MSSRPLLWPFRYMVNSLKIYSKNELCEKKQKMLYNLHEKYAYWDSSDRCSEFYMYSLEVLKMIKRHILNNDAFLKNDINFKMTYNDYEPDEVTLSEILCNTSIHLFDEMDIEMEQNISENRIREYVEELEEIIAEITQHGDIRELMTN